ncbi:MAG: PAS domain-containing protein, partial [Proteobacteria bacterium]|nr:PAS domain-containing protein [Pseudomonadota bacterium]
MRLTNLIFFLFGQLLLVIIAIVLLGALLGGFYLPALIVISVYLILMLIYVFSLKESLQNGFKIKWLGTRGYLSEINSSIEALSKSRWRYRKRFAQLIKEVNALASAIPDAGIIIDEFDNIEWCNRSSLTLLGVDQERDIGQKVGNIIRFPSFNKYLKYHKTDSFIDIEDSNNKRFLRFRIVEY